MSLKYGLNLKKKAAVPTRKTLFDDEDGDEDTPQQSGQAAEEISTLGGPASRSKPTPGLTGQPKPKLQKKDDSEFGADLSALQASKAQVQAAKEVDEAIFDYDSFHDAKQSVAEAKKAAARQDAVERKPKYINNLLDAADRRKKDQQVAMEKKLQREREDEGDEFADKEKFVTGAYKQQQEENRKLEEEERQKAEQEAEKKKRLGLGNGMQGFYRTMMDQTEQQHREAVEAAEKAEKEGVKVYDDVRQKTDAELAAELAAQGKNVHVNEEGQITDKRELLSAGLNIVPSGGKNRDQHGADHLKTAKRSSQSAFKVRGNVDSQQATRERQTRMMEEQLEAQAKRTREEEEEERRRMEKAAKSQKTEKDVSDAKARYLARKAAKERGEG